MDLVSKLQNILDNKYPHFNNQRVYCILNNKVKTKKLIKISDKYYIKHWFYFKKQVVPGFDCFLTKELAQHVLDLRLAVISKSYDIF